MGSAGTELSVIRKSKELSGLVMTVTMKSPKHFRFSLVANLQRYALECTENLYRANSLRPEGREAAERRGYQREAMTALNLLAYMAQLAAEQNCILGRQYEQIIQLIYDCKNLLGAWQKSDARRGAANVYGDRTSSD